MAYVTRATTKGGRNGRAMLDDGGLGAVDTYLSHSTIAAMVTMARKFRLVFS